VQGRSAAAPGRSSAVPGRSAGEPGRSVAAGPFSLGRPTGRAVRSPSPLLLASCSMILRLGFLIRLPSTVNKNSNLRDNPLQIRIRP
jgi:hypothetical protein